VVVVVALVALVLQAPAILVETVEQALITQLFLEPTLVVTTVGSQAVEVVPPIVAAEVPQPWVASVEAGAKVVVVVPQTSRTEPENPTRVVVVVPQEVKI
jgi:hypothetical protein